MDDAKLIDSEFLHLDQPRVEFVWMSDSCPANNQLDGSLNIFEADLTDLSHLGMQQTFFLKETNHAIIVRKTHICDDTNLTIMTP
jgi:hypothetical protein